MIATRRLVPGDEPVLDQIADDVFDGPVDPAHLALYLREPSHHLIVALDGALVIGQVAAGVHHHPDKPTELYLDNLGVAPSHQRQGIGWRLLHEMIALGQELGCMELWVATELDNVPARTLYERLFGNADEFVMYVGSL